MGLPRDKFTSSGQSGDYYDRKTVSGGDDSDENDWTEFIIIDQQPDEAREFRPYGLIIRNLGSNEIIFSTNDKLEVSGRLDPNGGTFDQIRMHERNPYYLFIKCSSSDNTVESDVEVYAW